MILQKSVIKYETCKNDTFSPIWSSLDFVTHPGKWFISCSLHPSLTMEPGHFLKIYGENITLFSSQWYHEVFHIIGLLEDCGRLLFIWHSLRDKIFHTCPSPTPAQLLSLCLSHHISLNSFLGVGAWGPGSPTALLTFLTKWVGGGVLDYTVPCPFSEGLLKIYLFREMAGC